MKFAVAQLLAGVDRAIEAERENHIAKQRQAVAEWDANLATYNASPKPAQLLAELRRLVAKARRGTPISNGELYELSREDLGFSNRSKRPTVVEPSTSTGLTSLRAVLASVTDDEVSTAALRDLGFTNIGRFLN